MNNCKQSAACLFTGMSILLVLTVTTACSNMMTAGSGSEAGNADALVASTAFIDLPSSVAKTPSPAMTKKHAAGNYPPSAVELYDGVREYIGLADALVHNPEFGVVAVIKRWHNSLDWEAIRKVKSWSHTEKGHVFTASFDRARSFAYQLKIYRQGVPGEPAFSLAYNGDRRSPGGKVFMNLGLLDTAANDHARYSVTFGTKTTGRTLDIKVSIDSLKSRDHDAIRTLRLMLEERNGLIHMSGCSYHPFVDSILPDTIGHCYVFTGTADTAQNRSMIHLGLPPASYAHNDSTLFTTYGLAQMFTRALFSSRIPHVDDTLKSIIVTSYSDSMTIDQILSRVDSTGATDFLYPPDSIETMTIEDFDLFLKLNASVSDSTSRAEFAALLWVLRLDQPVYFSSDGYAGNGMPAPKAFWYLERAPEVLEPLVPREVRDMVVE